MIKHLFSHTELTDFILQVRWFKDGSEIRKGKKYEIIAKGVQRILIVHKSVFDDEAEYECDARTSKTSGMLTVIGEKQIFIYLCFLLNVEMNRIMKFNSKITNFLVLSRELQKNYRMSPEQAADSHNSGHI